MLKVPFCLLKFTPKFDFPLNFKLREAIKQNKKAYSVELQLIPNSVITDKLPRTDAKLGSLSSLDEGGSRQNAPTTIAKTDKPNPTTKKQISQEQKKQAHLAREAGIKKSLDLLKKKAK